MSFVLGIGQTPAVFQATGTTPVSKEEIDDLTKRFQSDVSRFRQENRKETVSATSFVGFQRTQTINGIFKADVLEV